MAWMMLAAQGLQAYGNYRSAKANAKAQRAMKEYRNKMVSIANAVNQNAITQNTTLQIQQSAKRAVFIKADAIRTEGSAEASAAAAGVKGNSVNATLLDIQRNSSLVEKQRADDLENFFLQQQQQRLNSTLSAQQNQDLSVIQRPNLSSHLFGAAIGAAKGGGFDDIKMPNFNLFGGSSSGTLQSAGLPTIGPQLRTGPSRFQTQGLLI